MDELSQAKLDEVVAKDIPELSDNDIVFLQARRGYLNKEQNVKFASVLKEKVEIEVPVDATYVSTKDIKKKAASLGIDHKGKSREELEVAISTVEGPAGANKPE
jgi:hypothetical protein